MERCNVARFTIFISGSAFLDYVTLNYLARSYKFSGRVIYAAWIVQYIRRRAKINRTNVNLADAVSKSTHSQIYNKLLIII